MRGPWHTTWSGDVQPLLLCHGSHCDNRSQTFGGHGQQRHHNSIPAATVHNDVHNQYNAHTLCKPRPDLYIADWLSHHNLIESRD